MMHSNHRISMPDQRAIRACYMRGGTSKGVFFLAEDLPSDPILRDQLLLRIMGSPDAYGKQIDGMGAATSSTSKVVIINKSNRPDSDVDYLFGQVSVQEPTIDWSGNCGNLTAAVGPFAIHRGLVMTHSDTTVSIRIWQANIGKSIVAHVPMRDGLVVEDGDFELDGVTFSAAEIRLEFIDPSGSEEQGLLPTGNLIDVLQVPGIGSVQATLITAGNPTVVIDASALGLKGTEMQADFNGNTELLKRCEKIRACGSVAMGLAIDIDHATKSRPATPKLAFISRPQDYTSSAGKKVHATDIDLTARILSMGALHHALTGTGAIALAVAGALPGTLIYNCIASAQHKADAINAEQIRLGHPSGVLNVGAVAGIRDGQWEVTKALVSRSARRLMDGEVYIPARYHPKEFV